MSAGPVERLAYTPNEAAAALGIGRTKVYELINAGTLPSFRLGSSVRIPADALRAWVAAASTKVA